MDVDFDLWGDPVPQRPEKRGRPTHVPTPEKRLRVSVLRALNQSHEEIAAAMGVSEPTLRKHYLPELKGGMAQKRAEALVLLYTEVQKGNVSAIKEFLRQVERSDLTPAAAKPTRAPKLGKKAQAAIDAAMPDPTSSMGELMARRAGGTFRLN